MLYILALLNLAQRRGCGAAPAIANGQFFQNGDQEGAAAQLQCRPGYASSTGTGAAIACQGGQWVPVPGANPACIPDDGSSDVQASMTSPSESNGDATLHTALIIMGAVGAVILLAVIVMMILFLNPICMRDCCY